jgi:hypothetical protein
VRHRKGAKIGRDFVGCCGEEKIEGVEEIRGVWVRKRRARGRSWRLRGGRR